MIRRIEYPHIQEGAVSPQVRNELRKLVDQINAVLAELEAMLGGTENGE